MSHTMTVGQAAAQLQELVASLGPDDEIVLTAGDRIVARLVGQPAADRLAPRLPGNCRGMLTVSVEDDAHLRAMSFGA